MTKYTIEALISGVTEVFTETTDPAHALVAWELARDVYPAVTMTEEPL